MPDQSRPTRLATRWFAVLGVLLLTAGLGQVSSAYAGPAHRAQTSTEPSPAKPSHSLDVAADAVRSVDIALATGYTYWAYFTWNDATSTWELSPVGANDKKATAEDGKTYGFRWALHVGVTTAREPRADGDFDAICGGSASGDGPHAAFVLDYGTSTDAVADDLPPQPRGLCAPLTNGATVQQTLQRQVDIRTSSSGLVCGIDGYPSRGCGDTVENVQKPPPDKQVELALPGDSSTGDPSPGAGSDTASGSGSNDQQTSGTDSTTASAESDDSSNRLLTIGIPVVVVVLLGVGALVLRRRQS